MTGPVRGGYAPGVDRSVTTAVDRLLATRRSDGSWESALPSSAVSTAAALIALRAAEPDPTAPATGAGDPTRAVIRAAGDWLRAGQNADGGWGDMPGAPSTRNATALAVSALAGAEPASDAVRAGLAALADLGGRDALEDPDRTTLSTIVRVFLADAGLYDPARVPRVPVEVALLPRRVHQKVSFILPGVLSWGLMRARRRPAWSPRRPAAWLAGRGALRYLRRLREFEGPHGGAEESALMVALVVFGLARAGCGGDIVAPYRRYLLAGVRPDGSWPVDRDLELSGTCYLTQGLVEAGLAGDRRLRRTAEWIRRCQRQVGLPATGCPPGGWGWALPSSWPDTDDTALALRTLTDLGHDGQDQQVRLGADWLRRMRNRDGSWCCFVREGRTRFDAPCAVLTAHAAVALHRAGTDRPDRAVRWFAGAQRADGSVPCVWFRGDTAGTARVLEALDQVGVPGAAVAPRCVRWLLDHPAAGGGWGDGAGAAATVEETSWALLGLLGAGLTDHPAVTAGIDVLLDRQGPDGLWTASPVGYYYDDLSYGCDAMATGYALAALARFRRLRQP